MFRGKESPNRIELSRLVQDLLNFGVLGSLWLWGWGVGWMGVGGSWEVPLHTCTCMHMHTCTCMHMVNMIISCKWPPHWGNPWEFPMMSYMHACAYVWGAPSHHPSSTSTHPPAPRWGPPESVKIQ